MIQMTVKSALPRAQFAAAKQILDREMAPLFQNPKQTISLFT